MIYIVLYKNVSVALPLDSQYTKDWMQTVHPNIIVQRHANLTSSPFWAHHEVCLTWRDLQTANLFWVCCRKYLSLIIA